MKTFANTKTLYHAASVKKCAFLIVCFILFQNNLFSQEIGFPLIRNYTPKEYKSDPQVFSVLQDKHTEMMYFGLSNLGVLCYDGVKWKEIPNPTKTTTFSLTQAADGKIYVAGIDHFGCLITNAQGKTAYQSLTQLVPDTTLQIGNVWYAHAVKNYVYFLTDFIIFRYDTQKKELKLLKEANPVFYYSFVHNHEYYVLHTEKGIVKLDNQMNIQENKNTFFFLKNKFITTISLKEKILLPTRTKGLYRYDSKQTNPISAFEISEKDFLKDNDIYSANSLSNNKIALGSLKNGVLLLDSQGNTLQKYREENSLQNNFVLAINADTKQNLWLGLNIGISKTEHSQDLSYWNKNAGLKGSVYDLIRYQNTVYIATGHKVYYLDQKNIPQEIADIPVGQNWCFKEIQTAKGSVLVVGTIFGIYEIQGTKAKQIYKGNHALCLYQSKINPNRLLSTDNNDFISLLYENGTWKLEGKWAGLQEPIRNIEEMPSGELWLGTLSNGIIRVKPDQENSTKPKQVKSYREKEGLPSLNDCKAYWFKNKLIWGTSKGLYTHNPQSDRFEPFCELGKSFCDGTREVIFFKELPNGRIYMSSWSNEHEDVGYLKPNTQGTYDWVYQPFRRLPEIAGIRSMYVEEKGIFWLGGSEGLFRYDESKDTKDYHQKFKCFVREVRIAGDSVAYGGNSDSLGLKYVHNDITFEFASPFFDSEERTLYRFKLEGFEEKWSEWDKKNEKEYTNLWEGTYRLEVQAKNIYDVESEIGTYSFRIFPPWYRAWWAYLVYVVFFGLFIFWIVKWNTRRLEKEKFYLEELIKERTLEILQTKEEIETQAEELQTSNQALQVANYEIQKHNKDIKDSINAAFRIQTAMLPFQEHLDQFLGKQHYFMLFKPRDVVSGDFYFFEQVDNQVLIAVADCTGHGVPGAFMSMIGINFLEDITKNQKVTQPSRVLYLLNQNIRQALKQDQQQTREGMDMNMVCIDQIQKKISYSGAMNPMYYIENQQFKELKATKKPIGGMQAEEDRQYEEHTISFGISENPESFENPLVLYLCTDGYQDQFGGEKNRKFMVKKLRELLHSVSQLPMAEQCQILDETIENWKGDNEQIDDITVLGLRLQ